MAMTSQQFREKHARRLKGAIDDMRRGIENVTEAPGVKAAAKSDKMLQNLQEAISSGKWADRVKSVSLDDWKNKMISKGLPRVAGGIDASAAKVEEFAEQLLPYVDSVKKSIAPMPDLTLEDNINRMVAFSRKMSQFKKR